jgi:eukaryotic-like serine/threonine-protein kinase
MFLPTPGTMVAGKYQLESLLGEGGMGAVYRARHVLMDKLVALKWLRPELCTDDQARERLIREARSVARIRHANVVEIYDVDSHEGSLFLVMELLEGETLAELIVQGQLTAPRVVELLLGAMRGLAAAHERGIVHRDIKPENIFIVRDRQHPEGCAKLLDFGISKLADLGASPRLTQTGLSIGTPMYMSLEQLTSHNNVDARADVYALGVVLYHALSGELPFDGETFAGVVLSIGTTVPPRLRNLRPELPVALDRVVMKAMARRREDRYKTVTELISALQAIEHLIMQPSAAAWPSPLVTAAARTPGPPPASKLDPELESSLSQLAQGQRAKSRRHALIALAVVLGLGAAIATSSLRSPQRSAQPTGVAGSVPPSLPPAPPVGAPSEPVAEPPKELPALPVDEQRASPSAGESASRSRAAKHEVRGASRKGAPAAAVSGAEKPARKNEAAAADRAAEPARTAPAGVSGRLLREDF